MFSRKPAMTRSLHRLLCFTVSVTLSFAPVTRSMAEDIDLFTQPRNVGANSRPNILIVIDNSANWSAANQQWPGNIKQGEAELNAIRKIVAEAKDNVNIGLMMLTPGSGTNKNGGYVRFHIRQMTSDTKAADGTTVKGNKSALIELIGDSTCVDGPNSLNGTPNCIFKNFQTGEQISTAGVDYSGMLFETFKYFGGFTSPDKALLDQAGSPIAFDKFGALRYSGNPDPKSDAAAYTSDAAKTGYTTPINADNSCASNHIIFIGNGFPSTDAPASLLSGVGGTPTPQLLMPAARPQAPFNEKDAFPASNRIRNADEFAKFLFETDTNSAAGKQNALVYAIDAYNAQQDLDQTRLMKSMAKYGGGQYYAARSQSEIEVALSKIMVDIQAVNSVFTSATVPVNASNRTQQENEIYFGSFVPDAAARPRWYGNVKRYQAKQFGNDVRLADAVGAEALLNGAFVPCAVSFWTVDSGTYWNFPGANVEGQCPTTTFGTSPFSDKPDGQFTSKGGAAEMLRLGNNPSAATPTFAVNRTMYTCSSPTSCSSMVAFNTSNVAASQLGTSLTAEQHTNIIDYTLGKDVKDERGRCGTLSGTDLTTCLSQTRPSIHGDVVHARVVPVNYGGSTGVVLYYGTNDGTFRAVSGRDGRELWSFIAPEHHGKLKRLMDNEPLILYDGMVTTGITPTPTRKDYFFDGATGLYQNADNTRILIFPAMRRGGRMLYAFNVTNSAAPALEWRIGCPNLTDDTNCSSDYTGIGQTWSAPNVAHVAGFVSGTSPIIVMGGGYDACEDADTTTPSCASAKGRSVFVINAFTGAKLAEFPTERSVAADVSLVDRNGDGKVDHAYVADTGGSLYRLDFVNTATLTPIAYSASAPTSGTPTESTSGGWTMTKIAYTQGADRKFLNAPAVFATRNKVYLAIGSGDRERPLRTNYPYTASVQNRFYMFIDTFAAGAAVSLDGSAFTDFSSADASTCTTALATGQRGWFFNLTGSPRGEQTVSSALIFGGLIFFNTNAPSTTVTNVCGADLGEARGYVVNLLNASGAVGTNAICGGSRFGLFTGGGLPPTPIAATLPVGEGGKPISVIVGAPDRGGVASAPPSAQRLRTAVQPKRNRVYWYKKGNF
jgi:type IV pilus assembly protein PilY1